MSLNVSTVELHCSGDIFRSGINRKPKGVLEPFLLHHIFKVLLFIVSDKNSKFLLFFLHESTLLSALPSPCNLMLTVILWGRTTSCVELKHRELCLRGYRTGPNRICLNPNFLFLNIAFFYNIIICHVVWKCGVHAYNGEFSFHKKLIDKIKFIKRNM